jgi:phenylpropionate dioxygenase-like ring-hydroxylating dioxygenase large terminal subunit
MAHRLSIASDPDRAKEIRRPNSPPLLRDFWYIACPSSRLKKKRPRAVRVLDQELVLFRDASGQAHALADKCCHRGARLSLGRITDGALACGYHGWRFDGSGRCIHIPSLSADGRIAEKVGVAGYPTSEQHGYVWVWLGGEGTVAALPEIPDFSRYHWLQGTFGANCDWMKMVENNVDFSHLMFAHRWTHPSFFLVHLAKGRGISGADLEVRTTERGMITFSPPTKSAAEDPPEINTNQTFELPDRVVVHFRYWKLKVPLYIHCVPTGTNTCRIEWMMRLPIPFGPKVLWTPVNSPVFTQDKELLESSQQYYDQEGSGFERSVEADAAALTARRIVELAGNGGWRREAGAVPQRRVVHVKF